MSGIMKVGNKNMLSDLAEGLMLIVGTNSKWKLEVDKPIPSCLLCKGKGTFTVKETDMEFTCLCVYNVTAK